MITEFRKKSQITVPKDIVKQLDIKEGDQLNIYAENGSIRIEPVAVYPKKYMDELHKEIQTIKKKIKENDQAIFDNVEDMFTELDSRK